VARAHPAVDEAGGEAPHAVDELRAGEQSAAWASSGDGGVAAAGEDPAEALRNVALAVAWRWHRRPAGAVDRTQAKLRLEVDFESACSAGLTRAGKEGEDSTRPHEGELRPQIATQVMTDEIEREAVLTADCHLMDRHVISELFFFIFLVRKM
jgi:hypothetical protein